MGKASEVIILTDTNIWGGFGNGRYMGAYAIAAGCRSAGHSTTVIDYFTRKSNFFEYLENFISEETVAVGIASTFLSVVRTNKHGKYIERYISAYYSGYLWFSEAQELVSWMRELKALLARRAPRAKVVLGGTKSQNVLWEPEYFSEFDFIVLGPADRTFPEFVTQQKNGHLPAIKEYRGVSILDNAKDVAEKCCPEMVWTEQEAVGRGEGLPLEIARGCVFNCKFCHYNKQESFKKSIETLRREMIRNFENFGVDTYSFCDDCFNDHPNKVQAVCEMFLSLPFKVEWVSYARVDVAVKFPWTLDLMIKSGARGLFWGIESLDHEVARRAGKGTPPEKVKEMLYRLQHEFRDECVSEISLITGLPGETDESLARETEWLVDNRIVDVITVGALTLVPFVQSFDGKVIDFAEYSRNPEKYGFSRVSFSPDFWEHETMDLPRAKEWALRMAQTFDARKPNGLVRSIWTYPHLKTLGFSREEIFRMFREADTVQLFPEVEARFQKHIESYWERLLAASASTKAIVEKQSPIEFADARVN